MSHPGGGSGTGPGGGSGTGPGRDDAIPADQLLAEVDALVEPLLPLDYVAGLAQVQLADVLQLVDGVLKDPATTAAAQFQLTLAAFHIERAQTSLGLLSPARQHHTNAAAVGAPVAGEPVNSPHWYEFLPPRGRSGS